MAIVFIDMASPGFARKDTWEDGANLDIRNCNALGTGRTDQSAQRRVEGFRELRFENHINKMSEKHSSKN
jgi:hypothetical protein